MSAFCGSCRCGGYIFRFGSAVAGTRFSGSIPSQLAQVGSGNHLSTLRPDFGYWFRPPSAAGLDWTRGKTNSGILTPPLSFLPFLLLYGEDLEDGQPFLIFAAFFLAFSNCGLIYQFTDASESVNETRHCLMSSRQACPSPFDLDLWD